MKLASKRREVRDDDGSYAARLISPPDQGARLELQDVQAALGRIPEVMREALMRELQDEQGHRQSDRTER